MNRVYNRVEALLQVRPQDIAEELKVRPQWVVWKLEVRGGQTTKVPYAPHTGRRASSTDLTTWTIFDVALAAYESGRYQGIGFVFCSADPYTGVDLDDCVDSESGEIELWALEVARSLDSYTELSPSGTGLHIICRDKLQKGGRRGKLEMYSQGRFFTVTGHVVEVSND